MCSGRPDFAAAPRLVGDIGGTHARFALADAGGLRAPLQLRCVDHAGVADAVRAYLRAVGAAAPREAALALAGPVTGDAVDLTNLGWRFSVAALRRELGLARLRALNDFTALALALPGLGPDAVERVGGGPGVPRQPLALLGAGTGLGMSGLIPAPGGGWVALGGEGGHRSFAPRDDDEVQLWRWAAARFGHVSAERIVSGPGLELIHAWLCARDGVADSAPGAARIVEAGVAGGDARCGAVLALFCGALGSLAADLALTLGARGGVYLGGGIVPRLGAAFARSRFRARFDDKGRFSAWLHPIPVYVVRDAHATLAGAARALDADCAAPMEESVDA